MNVQLGKQFGKELIHYPDEDKRKIYAFILYVKNNGLTGLEGRNKSSDNVHKDDPQYPTKVTLAKFAVNPRPMRAGRMSSEY